MKVLRNILIVIIFYLFFILYSCQSSESSSPHKYNDDFFQIKSFTCEKVLDVYSSTNNCCNDGQKLILATNKFTDSQKWKLIPAHEAETYYILSVKCNKAIEYYCLPNLSISDEQPIHIYNFNKQNNQKWRLIPANENDSTYYISAYSNNLLIDIFSPDSAWCNDNQKIQLYRCKNGQNQKWILHKIKI